MTDPGGADRVTVIRTSILLHVVSLFWQVTVCDQLCQPSGREHDVSAFPQTRRERVLTEGRCSIVRVTGSPDGRIQEFHEHNFPPLDAEKLW